MSSKFKFIDLFAGIGGFHQAMHNLGGQCVFASEIDNNAIKTYGNNYNINSDNDVTLVDELSIPDYDMLCAGFPCQAFSKAGSRLGFEDETKGTLFFEIARLLKGTKPKYIILENVRNLLTHDKGNTIRVISDSLRDLGYNFSIQVMSPHQLNIPQFRERVYILGVRNDIHSKELVFDIPSKSKEELSIYDANIFEDSVEEKYNITEHENKVLSCWNEFYQGIDETTIGYPIWSSEFNENSIPSDLPAWKKNFVSKNKNLYLKNKDFIDSWLKKWNYLEDFTPTERKFEWQAGDSIKSIWEGLIQFRPSGVRVKRPTVFPALVAMVQIPIVGKYKRRITPRETARLQSFPDTFMVDELDRQAYKQFGNAVNVNCVEFLTKQLFENIEKEI